MPTFTTHHQHVDAVPRTCLLPSLGGAKQHECPSRIIGLDSYGHMRLPRPIIATVDLETLSLVRNDDELAASKQPDPTTIALQENATGYWRGPLGFWTFYHKEFDRPVGLLDATLSLNLVHQVMAASTCLHGALRIAQYQQVRKGGVHR